MNFKKALLFLFLILAFRLNAQKISISVQKNFTVDSLGACQGVFVHEGKVYLYGDREVGVIRSYKFRNGKLKFLGHETKLSANGKDIINHPTGIAVDPATGMAFIGNSSRMNDAGTLWKAAIFSVSWKKLISSKTMDGVVFKEIEDDAAVQGTRPELVSFNGFDFVATSDYGPKNNQVRLYDISKLSVAEKTSEGGILQIHFSCTPWVQNLHFISEKNWLVLVQNQLEGRLWRLTFLDFKKSLQTGKQSVISEINIKNPSELEGFAMLNKTTAIAVTSSKTNNVSILKVKTGK